MCTLPSTLLLTGLHPLAQDYKLLRGQGELHFLCPWNGDPSEDCYRWLQINQLALINPNVTLKNKVAI